MSFTGNFIGVAEDFQLHVCLNHTASKRRKKQVSNSPYSSVMTKQAVQRIAGSPNWQTYTKSGPFPPPKKNQGAIMGQLQTKDIL